MADRRIAALERLSTDLDALIAALRLGVRSQRQAEERIAEGERIAAGIRAVFRG